jgi:DNA-binding beta-propeller fold protein YncE
LLYDRKRNQVYLAAKDHIDVFFNVTLKYVASLTPQILSSKSQFEGLAMTPDGSLLLAANTFDGSLAVIIPILRAARTLSTSRNFLGTNSCTVGPLYIAATSNGLAFVTTGSLPGTMSCPSEGNLYIVNLAARAVTAPPNTATTVNRVRHASAVFLGEKRRLELGFRSTPIGKML